MADGHARVVKGACDRVKQGLGSIGCESKQPTSSQEEPARQQARSAQPQQRASHG
eukprot:COSAG01_NODE_3478_length_6026_cov_3.252067_4_plen_55_part_00